MHKVKECFLLKNYNTIVADPSQNVTIYLFIYLFDIGGQERIEPFYF